MTPRFVARFALLLLAAFLSAAPQRPQPPPEEDELRRLPNGRLQSEEIRKANHKDNLRDLEQIRMLAESVQSEIEKNEGHVLSLANLKKLEEVERLSRKIRDRMRRF